jgi:ribosomal protein S18 acetylase RimI-like enzyme
VAGGNVNLSVRSAEPADVADLVPLMHDFYAEANYPLDHSLAAASFLQLLSRPDLGCVWLVHSGPLPVGHAVLTVRYTMEHGGLSGYVDDLYVKPEFRRMGAGDALLSELFAQCQERGCKYVHVEVGATNEPALALYAKFGLVPAQDGRVFLSGPVIEGDT